MTRPLTDRDRHILGSLAHQGAARTPDIWMFGSPAREAELKRLHDERLVTKVNSSMRILNQFRLDQGQTLWELTPDGIAKVKELLK